MDENLKNAINELVITGLTKKAIYEIAKEEKEQAEMIEHKAEEKALEIYNKLHNTNYDYDCLILDDGQEQFDEYLKILQQEYLKLGVENEFNNVYSYKFRKNFYKAEKEYLLIGCEFLKIYGKEEESEQLKTSINGYMKDEYKQKLLELNNQFLGIKE